MNNFYVGQKVVFIGNGKGGRPRIPEGYAAPVLNGIYTVKRIYICVEGRVGIAVEELPPYPRVINGLTYKGGWCADEFRPLSERKTDISVLRKMLKDTKVNA